MMGVIDKVRQLFASKKEPEPLDAIDKAGIKIFSDRQVAKRLEVQMALEEELQQPIQIDDPWGRVQELKRRLQLLDTVVKTVAFPYLRAGNNPRNLRAIRGWVNLFWQYGMDMIRFVEYEIKKFRYVETKRKIADPNLARQIIEELNQSGETQVSMEVEVQEETTTWYPINLQDLAFKLEHFLTNFIFPAGLFLIGASWKEEDVHPSMIGTIQQYYPPQQPPIFDQYKSPWEKAEG